MNDYEKIKKSIMGLINDPSYTPMKKNDLRYVFQVPKAERSEFQKVLDELESDGKIYISSKNKVLSPRSAGFIVGIFEGNKKGYGFVEEIIDENLPTNTDEAFESNLDKSEDKKDVVNGNDIFSKFVKGDNHDYNEKIEPKTVYISKENKKDAMDGDLVMVLITISGDSDKKAEGVVTKVLKRGDKKIIGNFEMQENFGFVVPMNRRVESDIFVSKDDFNGAKDGSRVVCEIIKYPEPGRKPEGRIVEVIGQKGERYVEIDSIVRDHNLPDDFPEEVVDFLENIPDVVAPEDMKGRLDLRDDMIFTIDGDDSKDFDDAISISKNDDGTYVLGVHIADVTHYVREYTPLDKEALKRATSVYLVDKVIPMLPKKLSNGICSLNPDEDRLALSIIMNIDKGGNVKSYDIKKTVIRSKARMTYHKVSEILENNDEELMRQYSQLVNDFKIAEELAKILMARREKRGAIEFDFDESKIILYPDGTVKGIEPYERRISNKIIEEFMLVSNETIAEHFYWLEVPFVYRVHEDPDPDKLLKLQNFLNIFDYRLKYNGDEIHPKAMQSVIEQAEGKPEKQIISSVMLRSMRQARYDTECLGHFGLAAKYYCHFTSPIRRYPDLQVHRIIKEWLDGKLDGKRKKHYDSVVFNAAEQSSVQERRAELAERDVDDYYKAVFMENKIGEKFSGRISSITSFGIYVELDNSVEGLVRLSSLDEHYDYIESTYSLKSQTTSKQIRIGEKVEIEVLNVNVDMREIDFKLIGNY